MNIILELRKFLCENKWGAYNSNQYAQQWHYIEQNMLGHVIVVGDTNHFSSRIQSENQFQTTKDDMGEFVLQVHRWSTKFYED